MKYKYFVIEEPVFQTNCTFFYGRDNKETYEEITEQATSESIEGWGLNNADEGNCYAFIKKRTGANVYVVSLKSKNRTNKNIGILAHEVTHLTFRILQNANIPIRLENDEVFAYLHEFYFIEALKNLK